MYQAAHRSAAPISGPVRALYWRTSEGWAVRCGIDMYIHNHIYIYMYVLYYINITFEYIMYMYDYIYYIYTYSIWIILIIIICGENGQVSGFTSSWLHEMGNPPVADETTDQSKTVAFFFGQNKCQLAFYDFIDLQKHDWLAFAGRKISMHLYFRTHGRLKLPGTNPRWDYVWFT